MPNTLAHIGVQSLLQARSAVPRPSYLGLVWLGCVLPDVPWIASRVLERVQIVNAYDLELYASVQASLVFSIVLAIGLAALLEKPIGAAIVLAANSALHLLLDAVEIKPGNGVHLLAPFSWRLTAFELVWPEHWAVTAATGLGVAVGVYVLATGRFRSLAERVRVSPARAAVALSMLAIYLAGPLAFTQTLYEADHRGIKTLLERAQRTGKPLAIDRDRVITRDGRTILLTHYGERLALVGDDLPSSGMVSLRGRFVDEDTLRVTDVHVNAASFRDYASIAGLALIAAAWSIGLFKQARSRNGTAERP